MKKTIFYFILLIFQFSISLRCHGQYIQTIDSLEMLIKDTKNPCDQIKHLSELSCIISKDNTEKAIECAIRAYDISLDCKNEDNILHAIMNISNIYMDDFQLYKALEYAVKLKNKSEYYNRGSYYAKSLQLIGSIYSKAGDFGKSAESLYKSLRLYKNQNDSVEISNTLNHLGVLFSDLGDDSTALKYFINCLNYEKELGNMYKISAALNNIATSYIAISDLDKAEYYIYEALEINNKYNFKEWKGVNLMNLGIISIIRGDTSNVEKNLWQAVNLFTETKSQYLKIQCLINLGYFFINSEEIEKGLQVTLKAHQLAANYDLKNVLKISAGNLYDYYINIGDSLRAFKYAVDYYETSDSLNVESNKNKLSLLELQYKIEKERQADKYKNSLQKFYFSTSLLLLILIILTLMYFFLRQKYRMRIVKLENETLEKNLNKKNRELTTNVMYLIEKNKKIISIAEKLEDINWNLFPKEEKEKISKIHIELRQQQEINVWKEFEYRFTMVYSDFYPILSSKFPDLTANDLRICALLKLNLSSKEISQITGQQLSTIEHTRSRIRKKLGLSNTKSDLVTFISNI